MDPRPAGNATDSACFPRRRGDGPDLRKTCRKFAPFPPQARGWTVGVPGDLPFSDVSPAGAGMDPPPRRGLSSPRCFPRRRGDGPGNGTRPALRPKFPPQARGWTVGHPVGVQPFRVSPAGAGMDRPGIPSLRPDDRFPRRRGDGPARQSRFSRRSGFPPQARGWTLHLEVGFALSAVSPAGAGMDPSAGRMILHSGSFPRRRGDGPITTTASPTMIPFPPQARGWTPGYPPPKSRKFVSPAGAGMDRPPGRGRRGEVRFPRRRGDGPRETSHANGGTWFPPQARGWTPGGKGCWDHRCVSPAGAGMDPAHPVMAIITAGFPRRRGDGPGSFDGLDDRQKFPPQARGWTHPLDLDRFHSAVSPAGAGMDPRGATSARRTSGFPRRRGDGPRYAHHPVRLHQFPPQARGWTPDGAPGRGLQRVSPAGAGMDRASAPTAAAALGFPRRRGDGPRTVCPRR